MEEAIQSLKNSEIMCWLFATSTLKAWRGLKPGQPFFRYLKAKGESGGDQSRGGSRDR